MRLSWFIRTAVALIGLSPSVIFCAGFASAQTPGEGTQGSAEPILTVRALVVSPSEAVLSARISGKITSVPKKVGDMFRRGETLVAFDCTQFEARSTAFKAAFAAAETTLDAQKRMFAFKSIGQHDVDLAQAAVDKAAAELKIEQHNARNCLVRAPFDGRVVERHIAPHESVKIGDKLIEVVDHRNLELEILVPSTWLRWIEPSVRFSVVLDATDKAYVGVVDRIGANVDAASQSLRVFGRFIGDTTGVLSGMSGDVMFPSR